MGGVIIKEYSNDNLSLDDLLRDVKTHAGQLHFILAELKRRGAESSGHSIIRTYSNIRNIREAIANFAVVNRDGEAWMYSDGSLMVGGTRGEAELLAKSCHPTDPTQAVVKELK